MHNYFKLVVSLLMRMFAAVLLTVALVSACSSAVPSSTVTPVATSRTAAPTSHATAIPATPANSPTPTDGPTPTSVLTAAPTAAPTDAPPGTPSAVELARADLDVLLEQLERIHPEPFHGIARADWVAQLEQLRTDLETLTPEQALVELTLLVALLSREGRDGHQLTLAQTDSERDVLPIKTYEFDDGVYVTAAMEGYEALVGRRIVGLGGHPIDDVLDALEPLVARDGPATVPFFRTVYLKRTSILKGLGLIEDGPVELALGEDGQPASTASVTPVPFGDYLDWAGQIDILLPARRDTLYLSAPGPNLWWQELAGGSVVYIRYEQVQGVSSEEVDEITAQAAAAGVERVLFDLRQNPGGDNTSYPILLSALQDPAINQPDRLYVLTDHSTFSAAANLSTRLEQTTSATFAGEAMAGGLNFWNDVTWVNLNNWPIPARVGVSTRYWEMSTPTDPRLTIEPDLPFDSLAADYFSDRDPVLEALTTN